MKNGDWRINRSPSMMPKNKREHYRLLRLKVLALLGDKCIICGFSDERALQIDHVNSDGFKERKISGTTFFYHVLNNLESERYQILCANCNWIKRREKNEVKIVYEEDHKFPTEIPHKRIFKEKECLRCNNQYIPTNGRQKYCCYN